MLPHKIEKGLTDINGCLADYLQNVLEKDSSLFNQVCVRIFTI